MDPIKGFYSLRAIFPHFDATMLGIDIEKLVEERFTGPKHAALLEKHRERVANYEWRLQMANLERTLREVGNIHQQRELVRRAKISAAKNKQDFSPRLIEIAIRSLEKNGN